MIQIFLGFFFDSPMLGPMLVYFCLDNIQFLQFIVGLSCTGLSARTIFIATPRHTQALHRLAIE